MSSDAKSAIFASIRRSLAESIPFDAVHNEHKAHVKEVETVKLLPVQVKLEDLAEIFTENLKSIGGNCKIVEGKQQAIELVRKIAEEKNAGKIAFSDAEQISDIKDALSTDAEILINASKESLFDCDLGITSAQFGIAETGTLVIESDREFNRLTSLIPPVHVCILEADKVRPTLGETLEILERDLSRTITFITGPSRTSDIELTLAIGVHGPGELYVVLIK